MKLLLCALFAFLGSHARLNAQPSSSNADQTELIHENNAFAIDLYGQLHQRDGNLFFSPASISTAFAIVYAGARGNTASEMAASLHFMLPQDRLHPAMGELITNLNAAHEGYQLHLANALWAEKDESFLPGFLSLTKTDYGAGFNPIDFKTAPEAARAAINQWVEQQTAGKIVNLLGPGSVTPDSRLVLTNAIYFKGDWRDPFPASYTQTLPFHLSASQSVQVPLMYRSGNYNYFDGGTFQELELPYAGEELSMIVFLPKDIAGLPALEKSFTAENVQGWLSELKYPSKVEVTFPKFKMAGQFDLGTAMAAIGMKLAFQPGKADFAGITGVRDLWISAAVHKAYISVDEKGTEAAAATAMTFMVRAMPHEPPPTVFTADHPFLFLIRDNRSGGILFIGRLVDPGK